MQLEQFLRRIILSHIKTILVAVFSIGYGGKTTQISTASKKHRTTIAHFLNHGCWEDDVPERILKEHVVQTIYEEAGRSGKPVIYIVDNTIATKTKPSLQAMHPMEYPMIYFLCVDQFLENNFLCPVTDTVHPPHPFHLVSCL